MAVAEERRGCGEEVRIGKRRERERERERERDDDEPGHAGESTKAFTHCRSVMLGMAAPSSISSRVSGDFPLHCSSQRVSAARSYVCPSLATTGSHISSVVIGQDRQRRSESKTSGSKPGAGGVETSASVDDSFPFPFPFPLPVVVLRLFLAVDPPARDRAVSKSESSSSS